MQLGMNNILPTLIYLAEQQLQQPIEDMEIIEDRIADEDKLWVIATLQDGRQMKLCIHSFRTEKQELALRVFGNYIN